MYNTGISWASVGNYILLVKGETMNNKGLGRYQKDMLRFLRTEGTTNWHGISTERFTQRVAKSLIRRGLIEQHPTMKGWYRILERSN